MAGKVELVLPGLFDLPPDEISTDLQAELGALNRILRLASVGPDQAYSIDAMLRRALALEPPPPGEFTGLPLAQAQDSSGKRRAERLLLFQAVHLRPDLHSAIVVPIERNEKNIEDINIIINDLGGLFKVDFDIDSIADGQFLLELHGFDAPLHYPHPLSVLGKAANPYVEQSRGNLDWYRLLNEVQMFLHQHQINQARLRAGLLPINSLWFWGGGAKPPPASIKLACYCDEPLLARLTSSLGLATAGLAEIDQLGAEEDALVIDLSLLELLKDGRPSDIGTSLRAIENNLFRPLLRLIERDGKRLTLRSGYVYDFTLGRFAALRFWRRPRALSDWISRDYST